MLLMPPPCCCRPSRFFSNKTREIVSVVWKKSSTAPQPNLLSPNGTASKVQTILQVCAATSPATASGYQSNSPGPQDLPSLLQRLIHAEAAAGVRSARKCGAGCSPRWQRHPVRPSRSQLQHRRVHARVAGPAPAASARRGRCDFPLCPRSPSTCLSPRLGRVQPTSRCSRARPGPRALPRAFYPPPAHRPLRPRRLGKHAAALCSARRARHRDSEPDGYASSESLGPALPWATWAVYPGMYHCTVDDGIWQYILVYTITARPCRAAAGRPYHQPPCSGTRATPPADPAGFPIGQARGVDL
jgi:hypothetical protein